MKTLEKNQHGHKDKLFGENNYYSVYTSQILNYMASMTGEGDGVYTMKEGDIISVNVKNTNTTISQMLRNFFYTVTICIPVSIII